MRLSALALPLVLLLSDGGIPRIDAHGQARPPQPAVITAACTPGGTPAVNPPRIRMTRADHIRWSAGSGRVASFTITPKDPGNWPFAAQAFAGTPDAPALTPLPLASAVEEHPYAYNVTLVCSDGTVQIIDPDIIIGRGS